MLGGKSIAIVGIVVAAAITLFHIWIIGSFISAAHSPLLDLRNENFISERTEEFDLMLGDWTVESSEDKEGSIGDEFNVRRARYTDYTIGFYNSIGEKVTCTFPTTDYFDALIEELDWQSCSEDVLTSMLIDEMSQKLPDTIKVNNENYVINLTPGHCCGYGQVVVDKSLLWPKNISPSVIKSENVKSFSRFNTDQTMWPAELIDVVDLVKSYGFSELSIQISNFDYHYQLDYQNNKFESGWFQIKRDSENYNYQISSNCERYQQDDNLKSKFICLNEEKDLLNLASF
jgi:hypothetical protein